MTHVVSKAALCARRTIVWCSGDQAKSCTSNDKEGEMRSLGTEVLKFGGMAMAGKESNQVIRFGVFEADLRAGELRKNGAKVRLQEQPFQVLASLIERPGELVTRDELQKKLWPGDTFVDFDHGLNTAVKRLREALGDSAETPRYVETVARRGYRFVAPLNGAAQVPESGRGRTWHWRVLVPAAAILLAGLALGWLVGRRAPGPQPLTQRRLTANPEEVPVESGVLSPDGKYLAYSDRTGFYLRQVDSGETHPVPLPKDFHASPSAWFPDDAHMLVSWVAGPKERPGLWQLSVMGGTPRKLADDARSAAVSPDGSQIVFLRGERHADGGRTGARDPAGAGDHESPVCTGAGQVVSVQPSAE